jgi:hypothetical protein
MLVLVERQDHAAERQGIGQPLGAGLVVICPS